MKGEIALKKRLVLKAVRVVAGFEGFEGCEVRNAKKKMRMMRVEEKSRNSSFGERSIVYLLSLFQAGLMRMEKDLKLKLHLMKENFLQKLRGFRDLDLLDDDYIKSRESLVNLLKFIKESIKFLIIKLYEF